MSLIPTPLSNSVKDDHEHEKELITRKNFVKVAYKFYCLYVAPLPLPSLTQCIKLMCQSGKYMPAGDWLSNYRMNGPAAEALLQIAHRPECTSAANVSAIFFDQPATVDAYATMTFDDMA